MWDEVIIGSGEYGNSATSVCINKQFSQHISHNRVSYWLSDIGVLELRAIVFKDTDHGQQLSKLLASEASEADICSWLELELLSKLPPEQLLSKINNLAERAYENGRAAKLTEVQKVLGLY